MRYKPQPKKVPYLSHSSKKDKLWYRNKLLHCDCCNIALTSSNRVYRDDYGNLLCNYCGRKVKDINLKEYRDLNDLKYKLLLDFEKQSILECGTFHYYKRVHSHLFRLRYLIEVHYKIENKIKELENV